MKPSYDPNKSAEVKMVDQNILKAFHNNLRITLLSQERK